MVWMLLPLCQFLPLSGGSNCKVPHPCPKPLAGSETRFILPQMCHPLGVGCVCHDLVRSQRADNEACKLV